MRVINRAPLPERRPRLAFVFAALPMVLIGTLFLSAPLIYKTDSTIAEIFQTPVPQIADDPDDPAAIPLPLPDWEKKERVNILLVGIDKREDEEFSRTDTMILVSIDPVAQTVGLLSLPRDLKVGIPGYPNAKLNAAYVYGEQDKRPGGGVRLLQQTIRQNFGVSVHYFAQVDFRGFEQIVDTFGGVNVDPRYPIKDDEYPTETLGYTGIYFAAGLQRLDGKAALRYARTRHADNDFARARRQQEVILALRQQALAPDLLGKVWPLLDALGGAVRTDLSPTQVAALAKLGQAIPRENIQPYSIQDLVWGDQELNEFGQAIDFIYADWSRVRKRVAEMIPNPGPGGVAPSPDPLAKIAVRNGTRRDRLAARSVDRLKQSGFAGASVDETPMTDDVPLTFSVVLDYTGRGEMAFLAAKTLGLPEGAVRQGVGPAPRGVDILIVLGSDLPDPGFPSPAVTPTRRPN